MLIESKIRRQGVHHFPGEGARQYVGSYVNLFGKHYHFKPRPDLIEKSGIQNADEFAHVCEVTDEKAIARFLVVPGYCEFGKEESAPVADKPARAVQGQPAIVEEILDDDDDEGTPMLQAWVADSLELPVAQLRDKLSGMTQQQVQMLIDAELEGRGRKKYLDLLADVQDRAA